MGHFLVLTVAARPSAALGYDDGSGCAPCEVPLNGSWEGCYRGLNSCLYFLGVPYYDHGIMGPETLF